MFVAQPVSRICHNLLRSKVIWTYPVGPLISSNECLPDLGARMNISHSMIIKDLRLVIINICMSVRIEREIYAPNGMLRRPV